MLPDDKMKAKVKRKIGFFHPLRASLKATTKAVHRSGISPRPPHSSETYTAHSQNFPACRFIMHQDSSQGLYYENMLNPSISPAVFHPLGLPFSVYMFDD